MKPVIKEIEIIVEEVCKAKTNVFGYGIWSHHITQVVKIGKILAEQFNADPEIVEIGALLHDYAGIKDYSLHKEHHLHGAIEGGKILKQFDYPPEKIEKVKECILNHRENVPGKMNSPEVRCLANADAIAHIKNSASLLYLVYVKWGLDIDEGRNWVRNKLTRTWKKIDPELKDKYLDIYSAVLRFLSTNELMPTEITYKQ